LPQSLHVTYKKSCRGNLGRSQNIQNRNFVYFATKIFNYA
jgi:hypothetical protein